MSLTPEQQRDIIVKESAWIEDGFGQLDLSGFPDLNSPPPEDTHDGRFARDWRDTAFSASAAALRKFISDPDTEALQRAGEETDNRDFLSDVRDQKAERIVVEFKRRCPSYLPTPDNFNAMVTTLAFNALPIYERGGDTDDVVDLLIERGYWTVGNLESVFGVLHAQGLLQIESGTARNLSDRERLHVSRLAGVGRTEEAITQYLQYALPDSEPSVEVLSDPAYREACDDAVFHVFEASQADYAPTPERERFLLRFAAGRPLTLTLLQEAWKSCQANEARHSRSEMMGLIEKPEPHPVTGKEIDGLSDETVDRLYHDSVRQYANSVRRSPGILS